MSKPRRLGLIHDYVRPGDTTLGPAYERYKAAFAAMSPAERAADYRIAQAAIRALPHGERAVKQIEGK